MAKKGVSWALVVRMSENEGTGKHGPTCPSPPISPERCSLPRGATRLIGRPGVDPDAGHFVGHGSMRWQSEGTVWENGWNVLRA